MKTNRRCLIPLLAAATALALLPLAPVSASATDVSVRAITQMEGSHSCGPDQKVTLTVYKNTAGDVAFDQYVNGRWTTVSVSRGGYTHVHTYSSRSVTWKVIAMSGDLATVSETCK